MVENYYYARPFGTGWAVMQDGSDFILVECAVGQTALKAAAALNACAVLYPLSALPEVRAKEQQPWSLPGAAPMTAISTRAEAGEDAAVLLRELAEQVFGKVRTDWPGRSFYTFTCLLDINTPEAHLAAAMMLVPEGMGFSLHKPSRVEPDNLPSARVWGPTRLTVHGSAQTPAHALIAAIARR